MWDLPEINDIFRIPPLGGKHIWGVKLLEVPPPLSETHLCVRNEFGAENISCAFKRVVLEYVSEAPIAKVPVELSLEFEGFPLR